MGNRASRNSEDQLYQILYSMKRDLNQTNQMVQMVNKKVDRLSKFMETRLIQIDTELYYLQRHENVNPQLNGLYV